MELARAHPLLLGLSAGLLPQALPQCIGRRLARPTEVAIDLKVEVRIIHSGVLTHEGLHVRLVPHAGRRAIRQLLAQVQSDVHDHAGGAQALRIQHAHAEARIIHVAQLGHELFGVERPALAMTRVPRHRAAPQIEILLHQCGAELQVVARHALVVDGGQFLPSVEGVLAFWHGPPHAARAGEVIAWRGIEDAAGAGRIDAALDLFYFLRNIEFLAIELSDDAIGSRLHPLHQRIGAAQGIALLVVELAHRRAHRAIGAVELVGDPFLLRAQAAHLIQAPLIGLIKVNGIAHKELGKTLVALAAHGVLVRRLGLQVIGEPIGELAKGFLGLLHLGGVGVEAEGLEHRVGVGKPLALHNDLGDLAVRCHHAVGGRFLQGAAVAG